jgi:hypothetical protein
MPKIQAYRNLKKIKDSTRALQNQWSYKRPQDKKVQHAASLLLEDVTFKHPSGIAFEEYYSGTSTHKTYKYKSVFAKVQANHISLEAAEIYHRRHQYPNHTWQKLGCGFYPQGDRYFHIDGRKIDYAKAVLLDENRTAWVAV